MGFILPQRRAAPFFSRDSIQRQIVVVVAWLLRTFLRARRHARVRQRRTRRMDELGSCRPSVRRPPSSPTGNRFGILVSLRERQQPVGHRCAVVATAAADRRLLFPRERARVTASPPPHFKRQCMTVAPTTRWGSARDAPHKRAENARNLGGKSRRRPLSCDTSEGKVSQARNVSK